MATALPHHIQHILTELGYMLDEVQPALLGERRVMQALTTVSGSKWVLIGQEVTSSLRVVLKVAEDAQGKAELLHERTCREVLHKIRFAYDTFSLPREVAWHTRNGMLIAVYEYIPKESPFLSLPIATQFSYALSSFKAQESAHASTYEHQHLVEETFGALWARDYLRLFEKFRGIIREHPITTTEELSLLEKVSHTLIQGRNVIEQYAGFLTHTDFVPHNFRIHNEKVYLLDLASLRFGNKYEGWARFVNFMTLYNPPLAQALTTYVHDNRSIHEQHALYLMRLFRLGELWAYYIRTLERSEGDLHALNEARVRFWSTVLTHTFAHEQIPEDVRQTYIHTRDLLRDEEERKRQENLH